MRDPEIVRQEARVTLLVLEAIGRGESTLLLPSDCESPEVLTALRGIGAEVWTTDNPAPGARFRIAWNPVTVIGGSR